MTTPDEPQAVFPDPQGERHPDRPRHLRPPQTVKELIDMARRRIRIDHTWEERDDGLYCMLCAPGGYRIRKGANPQMHEDQRNPDTHDRNLSWATLQWLKFHADKYPMPKWPDCYVDHYGSLWCLICRRTVGASYDREHGEAHDHIHEAMDRITMRPSRLDRGTATGARRGPKRHMIDEIIASRNEGYDPDREAAASHGVFGDAPANPDRPAAIEGAFTARRGDSWQDKMGYHFADNSVPTGEKLYIVKDEETGLSKQVTAAHLDEWIEMHTGIGDKVARWRNSCNYGHHITAGVIRPCIGGGCECNCHVNADLTEPADPDA